MLVASVRDDEVKHIRRDPLLWFALSVGFLHGALFNFLPVTFQTFSDAFGASYEQVGRTQLVFFLSWLVVSLIGGWVFANLGLAGASILTSGCLALGLAVIGGARDFTIVLLGALLFGMGVVSIWIVCSSLISEHFGDKRQSIFFLLGIIDAAGAMVGPTALGWWFDYSEKANQNWRVGYFLASILSLMLAPWAWSLRRRMNLSVKAGSFSAPATRVMKEILLKPTIYGLGLATFLHGLAQVGMISWIGSLYRTNFQIDAAQAALFISLNSAGFFAGRTLLAWLTARWRVSELLVLAVCAMGGTCAFILTIASPSYPLGLVFFFLAGIFISADGPSINSYLGKRFAGQSATAFALMNGIGVLGPASGPYLIGVVGQRAGLEAGIWFMPMFSLLLSVQASVWFLRARRNHSI